MVGAAAAAMTGENIMVSASMSAQTRCRRGMEVMWFCNAMFILFPWT
jgi:hypothetical protein